MEQLYFPARYTPKSPRGDLKSTTIEYFSCPPYLYKHLNVWFLKPPLGGLGVKPPLGVPKAFGMGVKG